MTAFPRRRMRTSLNGGVLIAFVVVQAAIGLLAARDPSLALGATIVLVGAVLSLISPLGVAVVAFPAVLATRRLGGGGIDLSYADAVLIASTALALPYVPWRSRALRNVLVALAAYLVVLSITIIVHPSVTAVVELLHRMELVGGAVVVGAAISAGGKTRIALQLLIGACAVLAIAAVADSLSNGFEPAYPFNVNKNAAGFFLTCALLLLVVAPRQVALPRPVILPAEGLLLAGLVACQSRASAATFVGVLFIASFRRGGSRAFVPILGTAAVVAMIWSTSQDLSDRTDNARFNSLNTRIESYDRSFELWKTNPIFGVGVRFFRDPTLNASEPHNLIISSLGESGLVGTIGFVALNVAMVAQFRRRHDPLGRAALYLTIAHAVDSMAGIFWVAGTGTLPWLVIGLAVGIDHTGQGDGTEEPARSQRAARRSTTRSWSGAGGALSQITGHVEPASTSAVETSMSQR
ncbi:MAG: O-antigen ligase family protein [Acidimicrobiia bacterium]